MQRTKKARPLVAICATALLAALAVVLYALGFPLFPAAPFLQLDFSDVPALVAALVFGPIYGVAVNFIQNFIGLISGSFAAHAGMGNLMNFVVGAAFVVPYAIIMCRAASRRSQLAHTTGALANERPAKQRGMRFVQAKASVIGMLSIIIVGFGMNTIVMPLFFRFYGNMAPADIWPMVWGTIWFATALNAIKGVMLTVAGAAIMRIQKRLRLF